MLNLKKLSGVFLISVFSILFFSCSGFLNSQFNFGINSADLNDSKYYVNNTRPVTNNLDGWKILYLKSGELLSFSNYIEQGEYYIYFADSNISSFNYSVFSSQFKKTISEQIYVSNDEGDVVFDAQKNEYKSFEVTEPGVYNIKIQNLSADGYCGFYVYSDDGKAYFTGSDENEVLTTISDFTGTYNYKKGCAYLSWKSSNKDGIYYIYRGNQYIGKSNALTYKDSGVLSGTSYTYEIKNGTSKSAITLATYKINTGNKQANFQTSKIIAVPYEEYSKNYYVTLEKDVRYEVRWGDSNSKDTEVNSLMGKYSLGDFVLYIYDPDGNKVLTVDDNSAVFTVDVTGDYSVTIESKDKKANSYCGYLISVKDE